MDKAAGEEAAGGNADQQAALAALEWDWGSAYLIEFYGGVDPEEWVALRRDNEERLSAPAAEGLRKLVEDDYRAMPVPRSVAP